MIIIYSPFCSSWDTKTPNFSRPDRIFDFLKKDALNEYKIIDDKFTKYKKKYALIGDDTVDKLDYQFNEYKKKCWLCAFEKMYGRPSSESFLGLLPLDVLQYITCFI